MPDGLSPSSSLEAHCRVAVYVVNPWLASAISFALITLFFAGASLIHPHPLPTQKDLAAMPRWAVFGCLGYLAAR
jgi:hypothetical protein